MGWFLRYQKYHKLTKELIYCKSELEYRLALIKEIHPEFEKYQKQFCERHNINIEQLKEQHNKKIQSFVSAASAVGNLSLETLSKEKRKTQEERLESKHFSYLYKRIAKEIHPDKLVGSSEPEVKEKEELFKKASTAFKEHDWASLLEVANILNVKPTISTLALVCKEITKSIDRVKEKISEEEKRYGYLYAECETEEQKEALMKRLLRQFFGILI